MSTSIAAFDISIERGFLPSHDPLIRLPTAFDAWESVAQRLPKLLVSDQLHRTIADLPPFPTEALNGTRERERAMVLLSYLGHAYVWGGPRPELVLRAVLAVPWYQIAESLGRPPVLSYSSYALHNFFRFKTSREIECGNLALIQNFLGGIDEEWFILIHVDIERKAAPAIAALHACLDASEAGEAEELEVLLAQVESSVRSMHATLQRMPERCDPYIYYHRVRPYIRSGSGCLADTLTIEKVPAGADCKPSHPVEHRTGVPLKRHQRLRLELPVFVYGRSPDMEPLYEMARSLVVYARGGVLVLGATVKLGQELLIVNPRSETQAECRIAGFEPCPPMVRLEFIQPVPGFWGVAFPPENVDPTERKLPRVPRSFRRVECSLPIQVRQAAESASGVRDVCITQNISRNGLYFKSGLLSYRVGMRLTIGFLRHSGLFGPNANYTAQVVRVDRIGDGVGVAVRLIG
jgi:hypothetical protein